MVLQPQPGVLEVMVWPGGYEQLAGAQKARLNVNPGGYATLTLTDEGAFTGTKELAPGTYDYSISFYGNGFLVGDLIYEAPWLPVTIKPGRTTTVTWSPETGTGQISSRLDASPPIPANLILTAVSAGVQATWDAVTAEDLAGYRVYLRISRFDKFDLVAELDSAQTTYLHEDAKLKPGQLVEAAVTAFDLANNESERSPVATLTW